MKTVIRLIPSLQTFRWMQIRLNIPSLPVKNNSAFVKAIWDWYKNVTFRKIADKHNFSHWTSTTTPLNLPVEWPILQKTLSWLWKRKSWTFVFYSLHFRRGGGAMRKKQPSNWTHQVTWLSLKLLQKTERGPGWIVVTGPGWWLGHPIKIRIIVPREFCEGSSFGEFAVKFIGLVFACLATNLVLVTPLSVPTAAYIKTKARLEVTE